MPFKIRETIVTLRLCKCRLLIQSSQMCADCVSVIALSVGFLCDSIYYSNPLITFSFEFWQTSGSAR